MVTRAGLIYVSPLYRAEVVALVRDVAASCLPIYQAATGRRTSTGGLMGYVLCAALDDQQPWADSVPVTSRGKAATDRGRLPMLLPADLHERVVGLAEALGRPQVEVISAALTHVLEPVRLDLRRAERGSQAAGRRVIKWTLGLPADRRHDVPADDPRRDPGWQRERLAAAARR